MYEKSSLYTIPITKAEPTADDVVRLCPQHLVMLCRRLIPQLNLVRKHVGRRCVYHKNAGVMPVNTYYRYQKKCYDGIQPQQFKYFLVLDFEATCDKEFFPEMEIIEFPCLKVCAQSFQTLDIFHKFVRPVKHPILTSFCTELTGIDQAQVEHEMIFEEVLQMFFEWLSTHELQLCGPNPDTIFVTSGDWDLLTMLPNQCRLSDIPVPVKMTSWINLKKAFLSSTGVYPRGILDMLKRLELEHTGKLHSGIDDCLNIVKIMQGLAKRGLKFERTRSLLKDS